MDLPGILNECLQSGDRKLIFIHNKVAQVYLANRKTDI